MTGERRAPGPVESLDATVVSLADVGAGDRSIAGGKGANLGELVRAGFPVPPGFVITTVAYGLMLEKSGLAQTLGGLLQEDAEGEKIRAAFSGVAMPAVVRDSIRSAYRHLVSGAVAVRSSATAEDLPGAAFAGGRQCREVVSPLRRRVS